MPRTTIVGEPLPNIPWQDRRIAIFYGAADTTCALAFAHVDEVIDYIKAHPSKPLQG